MWEKFLTEINWPISWYPGYLNQNVVFAVVQRGAPICLEMKIESFIDNMSYTQCNTIYQGVCFYQTVSHRDSVNVD